MKNIIKDYQGILVSDYPKFINKYIRTKEFKRLKGITFFCGNDYTKINQPKIYYTRYDHSISVALITWNFTKNKEETIAALLHDIGTPSFSHTIDFMLKDYMKQEVCEKHLEKIISSSTKLKSLLKKDGIDYKRLFDLKKYKILENDNPNLCADRLDGNLIGMYALAKNISLDKIKYFYDDILVIEKDSNKELGFKSLEIAEEFFKCTYQYALVLQKNENKFILQYLADLISLLINKKQIEFDDLFIKNEKKLIKIMAKNFTSWQEFTETKKVMRSKNLPVNYYFVKISSKLKYINPLVITNKGYHRVVDVSNKSQKIYEDLINFKDSKYTYVKNIKSL